MGTKLLEQSRPPMWVAGRKADGSEFVQFGRHRIAIADVQDVSIDEERDRNISGLIMGAAAFAISATFLAYYVFEVGGRERFLIGAVFLACLSMAGIAETWRLGSVSLYEMRILLSSGEVVRFTSVDRDDILALSLKLTAARAD